jgi:hypothetical protein
MVSTLALTLTLSPGEWWGLQIADCRFRHCGIRGFLGFFASLLFGFVFGLTRLNQA